MQIKMIVSPRAAFSPGSTSAGGQEARVSRATANVEQAKANLDRALAAVAKAEASYTNAKSISDRRQTLLRNKTISVEAAETPKAELDIAQVEVARAAVRDAQAQEQLKNVTLELHTLIAPYNAKVVVREKELRTVLGAGEPVFSLVECKQVWVLASPSPRPWWANNSAKPLRTSKTAAILLAVALRCMDGFSFTPVFFPFLLSASESAACRRARRPARPWFV